MKTTLGNALDLVMDLVFPRTCLLCGNTIQNQPLQGVCKGCLGALGWRAVSLCEGCGVPKVAQGVCMECRSGNFLFQWAWSYGPYEGSLKRLIHVFKFKNDRGIGRDLARCMADSEIFAKHPAAFSAWMPVPLHPFKERNRGYNQAEILAAELAARSGLPIFKDVLVKCKTSVPQTDLGRQARWKNVAGTFALNHPKVIEGRDLILVDDVMTTGATAHHCAELLLKAGARSVGVVVVARSLQQ